MNETLPSSTTCAVARAAIHEASRKPCRERRNDGFGAFTLDNVPTGRAFGTSNFHCAWV